MPQQKLKKHEIAEKFIKGLVQGHIHSFLLIGRGGTGKTEVVLKTLDSLNLKENRHFKYINNHCTPKRFYQILKEVNKLEGAQLLILDDFDIVLKSKAMVGMLRSALWGDLNGNRKISWYSTTSKEDEEFYFKGKIIFLLNELKMNDPLIRALVSRGFYYNITLSNPEVIGLMRQRIKLPYLKLTFPQRKKVLDYIVRIGSDSKRLTLRTLELGLTLFHTTPNHYQRLLLETLE